MLVAFDSSRDSSGKEEGEQLVHGGEKGNSSAKTFY
jgi:hypothetical protein